MKNILVLFLIGLTVGCASTAPRETTSAAFPTAVDSHKFTQDAVFRAPDATVSAPCSFAVTATTPWQTLVGAANTCVREAQWSRVESLGNELAKREPQSPWGAYYLSVVATERGEYLRANWMLELAAKKAPDLALIVYQRARIQYALHDQATALQGFVQVSDREPTVYQASLFAAQIYQRDQDYDHAIDYFIRVIKQDTQNRIALEGLGESYIVKNEGVRAEAVYKKLIRIFPTDSQYRVRLAFVQETFNHDPMAALETYQQLQLLIETKRVRTTQQAVIDEKIKSLNLQKTEKKMPVAQAERETASDSSDAGKRGVK